VDQAATVRSTPRDPGESGHDPANNSVNPLVIGGPLLNTASGVVTANLGRLQVSGIFTNAGTVHFINSVARLTARWSTKGRGSATRAPMTFCREPHEKQPAATSAPAPGTPTSSEATWVNQSTKLLWQTLNVFAGDQHERQGTTFLFCGQRGNPDPEFFHAGLFLEWRFGPIASNGDRGQNVALR